MNGGSETKRAIFWAWLAAQCAGEPSVEVKRIVAALLRAPEITEFCSRVELGSKEHQAIFQRRPLEPLARGVLDKVIAQHGHVGVSPLALLLDFMRADPAVAERLAPHGLSAEAISAALKKT